MNLRHEPNRQRPDMAGVAPGQPLEAVIETNHPHALVDRLDGDGTDDAIDAGRRPTADEQGELAVHRSVCHANTSTNFRIRERSAGRSLLSGALKSRTQVSAGSMGQGEKSWGIHYI